jgi:hypothetical protein
MYAKKEDPERFSKNIFTKGKNEQLQAFLMGTVQRSCSLSKLRGFDYILRYIWSIACEEWWNLHIVRFEYHWTDGGIPELLPFPTPQLDFERARNAGCPLAVITKNIEFPPLAEVPLGTFSNQTSNELYVNMLPFWLNGTNTLPPCCRQYWPMIQECLSRTLVNYYDIGYLTIDERTVASGMPQRRPGLHVESPGVMPVPNGMDGCSAGLPAGAYEVPLMSLQDDATRESMARAINEAGKGDPLYKLQLANGCYVPGVKLSWGLGSMSRDERINGGIFMASNTAGTTAVWNASINNVGGEFVGPHGNIERMRGILGPCARTLEAGELVWMTDMTPHESLPIPPPSPSPSLSPLPSHPRSQSPRSQASSSGAPGASLQPEPEPVSEPPRRRQYFRLVIGEVTAWFADHSTENPCFPFPTTSANFVDTKETVDESADTDADLGDLGDMFDFLTVPAFSSTAVIPTQKAPVIVKGDKFQMFENNRFQASWNTGYPASIAAAKRWQELHDCMCLKNVCHLHQHFEAFGIHCADDLREVIEGKTEFAKTARRSFLRSNALRHEHDIVFYDLVEYI